MAASEILSVVLSHHEDGNQDVIRVVGVFRQGETRFERKPGHTYNIVDVFLGVSVNAPGFRLFDRAAGEKR